MCSRVDNVCECIEMSFQFQFFEIIFLVHLTFCRSENCRILSSLLFCTFFFSSFLNSILLCMLGNMHSSKRQTKTDIECTNSERQSSIIVCKTSPLVEMKVEEKIDFELHATPFTMCVSLSMTSARKYREKKKIQNALRV